MTFIGSCIIAYFFKINVLFVFLYLFILGEYLYILFCVDTKFLSIFFNLKKDTKNKKVLKYIIRYYKKKKKSNEKSSDGKPNSYKCKVDSNVFEINL